MGVGSSILRGVGIGNRRFWAKTGGCDVTNVQKHAQTLRKDLKSGTGLIKTLTENSRILRVNIQKKREGVEKVVR